MKAKILPRNKKQKETILKRIEQSFIEKEMRRLAKERKRSKKLFNPIEFKI
jgi:hypothetical protein